jgi:hypothetical protein
MDTNAPVTKYSLILKTIISDSDHRKVNCNKEKIPFAEAMEEKLVTGVSGTDISFRNGSGKSRMTPTGRDWLTYRTAQSL